MDLSNTRLWEDRWQINKRNWKTQVYKNENNVKVIIATHPSIADWTNIKTDPSLIIKKHLE